MKKKTLKILLLGALIQFSTNSYAQYYTFSKVNQTYDTISSPQLSITDSAYIDTNAALAISTSASFKAFGERVTGVVQIGKDGNVVALNDSSGFVFDPFFTSLRSNGKSEFHAKESVIGTDTVLEAEWRDFGIVNHPNSDYINFKATINFNSEIIEFHYGSSNITATSPFSLAGPYVVFLHTDTTFFIVKESLWVGGNPASPVVGTRFDTLDGFPANGTVYRFKGKSVTTGVRELREKVSEVSVYPNPASDKLNIKTTEPVKYYLLVDQLGRISRFRSSQGSYTTIPLVDFEAGLYFLISKFKNGNEQRSKVIIK